MGRRKKSNTDNPNVIDLGKLKKHQAINDKNEVVNNRDPKTGKFTKGNVIGKKGNSIRQVMRKAIETAMPPEEAAEIMSRLLHSDDEKIVQQTFFYCMDQLAGKPVTFIESKNENTNIEKEEKIKEELPEEITELLRKKG